MAQLSATLRSPSTRTGTFSDPEKASAAVSPKRHGTEVNSRPLCASARRERQQKGLNTRLGSAPQSS